MKIVEKLVTEMTGQELRQCRSLTLRAGGLMSETLTEERHREHNPRMRRKSRVWMIKDDNERLLAWSLIIPMEDRGYEAQFYTRKTERRKGYGARLMAEVLKYDKRPYVFPHDKTSGDFFKKRKKSIRFDPYDEKWMN